MIASWGNSSSNCISQLQYGIRRLKEAPEFGFGQCHHAQLPSSSLRATNAPGHRAGTGGSWSLRAWQLLGPSVPAVATAKIREKVYVRHLCHLPCPQHQPALTRVPPLHFLEDYTLVL